MEVTTAIYALRGADATAKARATETLYDLVNFRWEARENKIAMREAGAIPLLVALLEHSSHVTKEHALGVLGDLAFGHAESKVAIVESGAVPLLVAILECGYGPAEHTSLWLLEILTHHNEACCFAIRDAGGIPRLVALVKQKFPERRAVSVLRHLCANNAADMVAIALDLGGVEAIAELARRGGVTIRRDITLDSAGSKRKAALVVAALLRDCVPGFKLAPRDIKMAIGSFF